MLNWAIPFLSWWGLVLLATVDATFLFFLPLAIDAVVILLSARRTDVFWVYPLLATIGSVMGSAFTYWVGRRVGEAGLERFVSPPRLERIKNKVEKRGAVAMALPALIPPPFPFTPFVLSCGALDVDRLRFFGTLALVRLFRFGIESVLARIYGRQIIGWMRTDAFRLVVGAFVVVAVIGSVITIYRVVKSTRGAKPRRRVTA